MNTIDILLNRVSLRKFKDKEVSAEEKDLIFRSMFQAPTAGNMQLYSIIDITDQSLKDKLSETCDHQSFIAKAPFVMIIVADSKKWWDYYKINACIEYCDKQGLKWNEPKEADLMLAIEDAMCAAQNGVIAAESLGIGSCYIGDILENYEVHRDLLKLPKHVFPIAMLVFGHYPDDYPRTPKSRFDSKYMLFENEYKSLSEAEIKDMFSKREKFNPENTYEAENYAQMFYARKSNSEFMQEMIRSVKLMLEDYK